MRNLRLLIPSLGLLALGATGCFITSAQVLTHFDLPNPFTIDATDDWERLPVDLATDVGDDYTDNKDKLEGLTDVAILGTFTNTGGGPGTVTVWITPDLTNYTSRADVEANAVRLWGPASIGAAGGADATVTLSWDDSAALFQDAGKQVLIDEAKGDGTFTLYTTGSAGGSYNIEVTDGKVVLVLDGGV